MPEQVLLTTLDNVSTFRQLKNAADETAALSFLQAASAYVEKAVGRALTLQAYTKTLSGDGAPLLLLPHWPIVSVTSLSVDGDAWDVLASGSEHDGEEAFLPEHGLWLEAVDGAFPRGTANVLIAYTAGYQVIPEDLQLAVAMLTHLLLVERGRIGDGAKTLGPENIQTIVRNPKDYEFIRRTIRRHAERC